MTYIVSYLEIRMPVVKLSSYHVDAVKPLFYNKRYMGVDSSEMQPEMGEDVFNQLVYDMFCSTYLSDLTNFHAYGYVENDEVKALISFYESVEEPAWYYTIYRSSGNNNLLRPVLDAVIAHNELENRLKFYTLVHRKHSHLLRRFHWSEYNDLRYDYVDEIIVPAKTKCIYTNYWELLFKRMLLPEDSVVRCNFLKNEYRSASIPVGGYL
jgi:hypothetical protein